MAVARDSRPTPGTSQTTLRWRRARLEVELAKQLADGQELVEKLAGRITYKETPGWELAPDAWHQRNRTILAMAFTDRSVHDVYDTPTKSFWTMSIDDLPPTDSERLQDLRQAHAVRLRRLADISSRIDLYDEAAAEAISNEDEAMAAPIFVVHGRDDATKNEVARTLQQLTGTEPVILHEQPDDGATVIEKFEQHANMAAAAVVILSPDDVGGLAPGDDLLPRARQNVVLELGWFWGKLGRGRVIALLVDEVEQPSDMAGVLYIVKDAAGGWRTKLARELRNAGLDVDANKLLL